MLDILEKSGHPPKLLWFANLNRVQLISRRYLNWNFTQNIIYADKDETWRLIS